ncbi:hypothetical protein VB780_11130 [Leptolyngbya sp. CCNP1308]|uniref:hypothetical protein n=1 Tax=Leptolyngbya sp. CCNP1308 TaxID=3110255 RepID=UPI002B1FD929|nr:hypothetical protein [Leptolyngbya sp. CCNP1308]MEA5449123.1 hypothetical protein [Leptolyngbya sp. CCNP1308]
MLLKQLSQLIYRVFSILFSAFTLVYVSFISQPFAPNPTENELLGAQVNEKILLPSDRNSQISTDFTPDLSDPETFLHVSDSLLPGEIFLLPMPNENLVFRNLKYPLPSSYYRVASIEESELEHSVRGGDKELVVHSPKFIARLPEWRFAET